MSHTRREFIRDIAVAGAALTTGATITGKIAADAVVTESGTAPDRCPYFDQPMYCKDLSPNGRPMCEK